MHRIRTRGIQNVREITNKEKEMLAAEEKEGDARLRRYKRYKRNPVIITKEDIKRAKEVYFANNGVVTVLENFEPTIGGQNVRTRTISKQFTSRSNNYCNDFMQESK